MEIITGLRKISFNNSGSKIDNDTLLRASIIKRFRNIIFNHFNHAVSVDLAKSNISNDNLFCLRDNDTIQFYSNGDNTFFSITLLTQDDNVDSLETLTEYINDLVLLLE